MFNNDELIINAKMDNFRMNKNIKSLEHLTFINYLSIQIKNETQYEYIIINMFHPDCYYILESNKLVKKDLTYFSLFKIRESNEIPDISEKRKQNYEKLAKTKNFKLKYVELETQMLGKVYIELMYIPHKKDFVNSISLICNDLILFNSRGALVSQQSSRIEPSLV